MKVAFVVHSECNTAQVMQLLEDLGIDYYTRWDETLAMLTALGSAQLR